MRPLLLALQPRPVPPLASRATAMMAMDDDPEPEPMDPAARAIDIILRTWSWAFLPLIFIAGLSLAAVGGATFPIRVGAPRDPLAFPVPAQQYESRLPSTHRHPLLLASNNRDPVFDDLTDSTSAARALTLPPSEQRRETKLQELEDERLEQCRSSSKFSFDQCFFFGSMDTVDSRRAMEGGGALAAGSSSGEGAGATRNRAGQLPQLAPRSGIPTW